MSRQSTSLNFTRYIWFRWRPKYIPIIHHGLKKTPTNSENKNQYHQTQLSNCCEFCCCSCTVFNCVYVGYTVTIVHSEMMRVNFVSTSFTSLPNLNKPGRIPSVTTTQCVILSIFNTTYIFVPEIRAHGVGYYQFSKKETERGDQLKMLDELRQQVRHSSVHLHHLNYSYFTMLTSFIPEIS